MKMRVFLWGTALAGALLLLASPVRSQDKDKKDDKKQPSIEDYLKLAQPGPEHKRLNALDGSWDCIIKMWMDPSKPPTETKGTFERKWIMGGRYLQEEAKGEFAGMPFQGFGLTGYDNIRKKYTSMWVDNMGTGIMTSLGSYDADKKAFTFITEDIDPFTGKPKKMRSVITVVNNDKHIMEMFEPGPDGKEVRMFELTATRKAKKDK
jgi:hypothetical protein